MELKRYGLLYEMVRDLFVCWDIKCRQSHIHWITNSKHCFFTLLNKPKSTHDTHTQQTATRRHLPLIISVWIFPINAMQINRMPMLLNATSAIFFCNVFVNRDDAISFFILLSHSVAYKVFEETPYLLCFIPLQLEIKIDFIPHFPM